MGPFSLCIRGAVLEGPPLSCLMAPVVPISATNPL